MTPTWRVLRQAPVFTHLETLSSLLSLSFSYNLTSPAEAAVSRFEHLVFTPIWRRALRNIFITCSTPEQSAFTIFGCTADAHAIHSDIGRLGIRLRTPPAYQYVPSNLSDF